MDRPLDILKEFPVRKSKSQKQNFRVAVQEYCESLGYSLCTEKGSLGVRNLVIGDLEKADYLITAHYDTCAGLPFPNLITPCSFWLFLGWQLLLVLLLCVPAGVIGGLISVLVDAPEISVLAAYILLIVELALMLIGPANRNNANDNTSGVVTLLETAATLPEDLRSKACFVLFDLEEAGLLGSSAYRSAHRKTSSRQMVLNLDCVGEGDEILLFPTKKLKKDRNRIDQYSSCCKKLGGKTIAVKEQGFAIYPSDQMNFPLGFGIAAFCRSKWAGLYLGKIHTKRDTVLDENNVALLREYLISVIRRQA